MGQTWRCWFRDCNLTRRAEILAPDTVMNPVGKSIWRWSGSHPPESVRDELAEEEPLEIQVESRPISVTLRTPGHDDELAVGFLLGEGVIRSADDIKAIRPYPRNSLGNSINLFLQDGVAVDFSRLTRHVFASSSCGLCGKASIEAIHHRFPPLTTDFCLQASKVPLFPRRMREAQVTFEKTGGLHAAALFGPGVEMWVLREDVGRHNAVDKVVGSALLGRTPNLAGCVLMVSGRVSFEIMQKALAARIPAVAAVSAPTSLAVEFAQANCQILLGFVREDRFNIYSEPDRVRSGE